MRCGANPVGSQAIQARGCAFDHHSMVSKVRDIVVGVDDPEFTVVSRQDKAPPSTT